MKTIVILWFDPLLKRQVCELHQVKSEELDATLVYYKKRAANDKMQGFGSKHRFLVVDKVMAFM